MKANLADRLAELVRRRNRELAFDALLKAALGIAVSLITFGMIYWFGWFIGFFAARQMGLHAWQFGLIVTGIFLLVATWWAWRRVDPLAGLERLSDEQWMLTMISQASPGRLYFSPQHASAGLAVLLIGGPAGVIEAFGIWTHRIRADAALIDEAARLLAMCESDLPTNQVRNLHAAFLLTRLALIKVVPRGDARALSITEKGRKLLTGGPAKTKPRRDNERGRQ